MGISDNIIERIARLPGVRRLWIRYPIGSVPVRVRHDIWRRPAYAYGVYRAADLARRLGVSRLSVVELGVAGGRGLLALQDIARQVAAHFHVHISVFGFDTGKGMPAPADYRDLPHVWSQGYYRMDRERLQARLPGTTLVLGNIAETIPSFLATQDAGPVGFAAFDLDFYSSTKAAFRLFEGGSGTRLPRVYSYFDDVVWPETACHNEHIGELCAIREFNLEHAEKKLCPIHMLRNTRLHPAGWNDQMYVLHDFQHPLYCKHLASLGDTQMAL